MGIIAPSNIFLEEQLYKTYGVVQNRDSDTLDVEMSAGNGLPFIRTDTAFTGTHDYTEVAAGKLQLIQYQGWLDTVFRDDATILDDATIFDDTNGGEVVMDYLMGSTAALKFYEGAGVFLSDTYDLHLCRRINGDMIEMIRNIPVDTTMVVEMSISKDSGLSWGTWQSITHGSASGLLLARELLDNYKARYRVTYSAPTGSAAPYLQEFKHTLNSLVLFRMAEDGVMKTFNGTTGSLSSINI